MVEVVKAKRPALFSRKSQRKTETLKQEAKPTKIVIPKQATPELPAMPQVVQTKAEPSRQASPEPDKPSSVPNNIGKPQQPKKKSSMITKLLISGAILIVAGITIGVVLLLGSGYQEEVIQKSSLFIPLLFPKAFISKRVF
jgi:hypothetical protein